MTDHVGEYLTGLTLRHQAALMWFANHRGTDQSWPAPIPTDEGPTLLANKAKGIYKPEWTSYALSVKQTLSGPYSDRDPVEREDGSWLYMYFQENEDPTARDREFTNRGLMACLRDRIPIGVMRQVSPKPNSRYRILGLAFVSRWEDGYFFLEGIPPSRFDGMLYEVAAEIALPETKIITEVTPRLQIINNALAERLKGRPEGVHDLTPRQFEQLVGELLTDMARGRVEITPYSKDGGRDLLAYIDVEIGRLLFLVEAKKYRRDHIVGVELVRSLYGVVCSEDASHATLVTTSSFTAGARKFQSEHQHRLSLRDYDHVAEWLRRYGTRRH